MNMNNPAVTTNKKLPLRLNNEVDLTAVHPIAVLNSDKSKNAVDYDENKYIIKYCRKHNIINTRFVDSN